MSSKEKLNRAYLESKINRILEPMVVSLISEKPDDAVSDLYSMKYPQLFQNNI